MVSLGSWMNEILIDWGVDPKLANMFDETIIAVLMIGVSIGLDYLCQAIFVGGMKQLYKAMQPHQWNYIADETQGGASSYSYLARYIGLLLIAPGLCAGKRDTGLLTENMCGVYHCCHTVHYQRLVAGDAGCI